jgi:hypothetical protein
LDVGCPEGGFTNSPAWRAVHCRTVRAGPDWRSGPKGDKTETQAIAGAAASAARRMSCVAASGCDTIET